MDPHPLDSTLCRIGIQTSQTKNVVLGLAFLHNFYMLFDTDLDRVGIAYHNITKSKYYQGPNYAAP